MTDLGPSQLLLWDCATSDQRARARSLAELELPIPAVAYAASDVPDLLDRIQVEGWTLLGIDAYTKSSSAPIATMAIQGRRDRERWLARSLTFVDAVDSQNDAFYVLVVDFDTAEQP